MFDWILAYLIVGAVAGTVLELPLICTTLTLHLTPTTTPDYIFLQQYSLYEMLHKKTALPMLIFMECILTLLVLPANGVNFVTLLLIRLGYFLKQKWNAHKQKGERDENYGRKENQ